MEALLTKKPVYINNVVPAVKVKQNYSSADVLSLNIHFMKQQSHPIGNLNL